MRVTILNSSPRKNGVTTALLELLVEGMHSEGAAVEKLDLYDFKIKFCDGCFQCWYQHPGVCKIKDDFNDIYKTLIGSDLVIIASPIYGMMINGILKTFFDRMSMVSHLPDFVLDENSSKMVKPMYDQLPPVAVLLIGNMAGREIFNASTHFISEYFRITNTDVLASILRHQSELLIKPILEAKKSEIFNAMKDAGRELIKLGKILPETQVKIEQDMLNMKDFIHGHNIFWKICVRKNLAPLKVNFDQYPILKM